MIEVVVIGREKGLVGWLVRRNDGNALMNWEKYMKFLDYLAPHF